MEHPFESDIKPKQYWGDSGDTEREWNEEALIDAKEEFDDMCKQIWKLVEYNGMSIEEAMYDYLHIRSI